LVPLGMDKAELEEEDIVGFLKEKLKRSVIS
jgi:hypothetical protein